MAICVGDVLQGDGLAGLRRRHDQATLTLADRRHDVDETAGELVRRGFLLQTLLRIQRSELVELRTVLCGLHGHAVDGVDGLQRHELLTLVAAVALTRGTDGTVHGITLAQPILLDLAHGNVHVVRTRQIAGGTHKSVGIEHVDDARDRHEILFRLLVTLFAFSIAIRALVTLVAIIVAVAGAATTLVTLVIIAVAATQATATTIHTVTPIAGAATATTREVTVFSLVTTFVIIAALRRQRGENVIKVAHDVLILRLFHRTTATARLNVGRIILTMATTVILLRRSIVQSQFGQQIGGSVRITAATALRSLIDAVQGVHRGHDIGRILARRSPQPACDGQHARCARHVPSVRSAPHAQRYQHVRQGSS